MIHNVDHQRLTRYVHSQAMGLHVSFGASADPVLQRAFRSYSEARAAVEGLLAQKLDIVGFYDAPGMQRAVNICFWGRSGSFLLASYLDSHDHLVMLPMNCGESVYHCVADHESLSVWEKLIAYPYYSESRRGLDAGFFHGQFPIPPAHYYAAVHALYALYADRPPSWLNTPLRFLQFLHVAYAVALGRRPGVARPLMIYAQHWFNEHLARHFREDFPAGTFIHTVRDPVSGFDSWYERWVALQLELMERCPEELRSPYFYPAAETIRLIGRDQPHGGAGTQTRAVRFEDLHLAPEATMRRVAETLGIPYRPGLVQSTFNGEAYTVEAGGGTWVGANPAQAKRRCKNQSRTDRWLLSALLQENFTTWNYPLPGRLRPRWQRACIIAALLVLPLRVELLNARLVMQRQVPPMLRRGRIGFVLGVPLFLVATRLWVMRCVIKQSWLRLSGRKKVMQLL